MTLLDGESPDRPEDWVAVKAYLGRLHAIRPLPEQRPGAISVVAINAGARPTELVAMPADVRQLMLRSWALLHGEPVGVIHGDPNAGNVRMFQGIPALIDWEEARVDYIALDVAGLPHADRRSNGYAAAAAWEAFLFWETDRPYAERRLAELRSLVNAG
jgi:Ser/Thr protein kinase RdoA (MazF antagonist)